MWSTYVRNCHVVVIIFVIYFYAREQHTAIAPISYGNSVLVSDCLVSVCHVPLPFHAQVR